MKSILWCLCLALCLAGGASRADELADAGKALDGKAYARAMEIYTRLANAGNPEAQFHLGEMYWYGEGTPVDLAKADGWFKRAASAGNAAATAALGVMKQRELRRADIDYWVKGYQGEELRASCARPAIPVRSISNSDIKAINTAYASWQACYNTYVEQLQNGVAVSKRIPADIELLMNEKEFEQATAQIARAYASIAAGESAQAQATLAQHAAWFKATEAYAEEIKLQLAAETERIRRDDENRRAQLQMGVTRTKKNANLDRY